MIFTIGYDGKNFTAQHLARILDAIDATLIDVRLTPFSRIKGWGTNQLKEAIGADRYLSRKDLGGGAVTPAALKWLEENYYSPKGPHCVLLCKEENPGACHRHHEICADRFPDAVHIFRDQFMNEKDLDGLVERDEEPDLFPVSELPQFVEHCRNFAA